MSERLSAKFWGVRGSYPTPGTGTVQFGGNTACVEICAGEKTLILDAGTGIIPLGRKLTKDIIDQNRSSEMILLFSHLHHDHTQGFPFFAPAYMPNVKLHVFGPGVSPNALEDVLEQNQSPTSFPVGLHDMAASKVIRSLRETQTILWDAENVRVMDAVSEPVNDTLVVRIHRSYAHPGGVYVYRISWHGQSIVYATDTEGYVGTDRRLVAFAHGADLLIHDAQYKEEHYRGEMSGFSVTQGYGHSTVAMACATAEAAHVKKLVLFHHDPGYDDEMVTSLEHYAKKLFKNALAAYEGLAIPLQHSQTGRLWRSEKPMTERVKYVSNG